MTFSAYRGNAFEHTHENHAFNRLHDLLKAEWADRDEPLNLFGNFFVEGRELDALVVKRDAIIVVDFKDYGGQLSFSENAIWKIDDAVVKGGSHKNPYQQIRKNKHALIDHIEHRTRMQSKPNLGHISGLVLFHQDIEFDPAELPHGVSRWFHITDFGHTIRSIDAIASQQIKLSDSDSKALVASIDIPPYWPDGQPEIVAISHGEELPSRQFSPTISQQRALDAADVWLTSETQVALVVEGMVSTGKRTLLPPLIEKIEATGRSPLLIAPNARIAQSYLALGRECRSLYSFLYSTKADGLVDDRPHYPVRLTTDSVADRVLVFLEAHLLSNSLFITDTAIYGSGKILDDLLNAIGEESPKLLIMGDQFQLSRGDLELSLLRAKLIIDRGHMLKRVSLDEQIRPDEMPKELLEYQKSLVGAMARGHYNRLPKFGGAQVSRFESTEQGQTFGAATVHEGRQAVFLCGKNALAQELNAAIRSKYLNLPSSAPLALGDKVDFHNRTPVLIDSDDPEEIRDVWVKGGEIGIVEAVDEEPELRSIRLKGRDHDTTVTFAVAVIRISGGGSVRVRYLPDYLLAEKPELNTDHLVALRIFAQQDAEARLIQQKAEVEKLKHQAVSEREGETEREAKAKYEAARNQYISNRTRQMMVNGYFHAARLRFAYAMTVHRAQGRHWERVVVNARESSSSETPNNNSYFRWLYTASTCARESLGFLDYPQLDPLSNAQWKENPQRQIGSVPIGRQYSYDKKRRPSEADLQLLLPTGFDNMQPELIALLLQLNDALQGSDWLVDSVAQHQYQEHYVFRLPSGESVKVRFTYDKEYTVTNVTPASGQSDLFDSLWALIEPIRAYNNWEAGQAVEAIEERAEAADYQIVGVEERPYRALVTLERLSHAVQLEINVNKEGMVSSIRPLRATNEEAFVSLPTDLKLV